jgi:hypothetical protein
VRVDKAESINDNLALYGLNGIDDDSYTAGVQAFKRLQGQIESANDIPFFVSVSID